MLAHCLNADSATTREADLLVFNKELVIWSDTPSWASEEWRDVATTFGNEDSGAHVICLRLTNHHNGAWIHLQATAALMTRKQLQMVLTELGINSEINQCSESGGWNEKSAGHRLTKGEAGKTYPQVTEQYWRNNALLLADTILGKLVSARLDVSHLERSSNAWKLCYWEKEKDRSRGEM